MDTTPLQPPQAPPTPPETAPSEPAPEVFISQATQKTPPPPKRPVKPWRYLLVIPPAVALGYGIVTDYGPGFADSSWYLFAFMFKMPYVMALVACIVTCIAWGRQKINFGIVAIMFAAAAVAYFIPSAVQYIAEQSEDRSFDSSMRSTVSQMHYDIYLPADIGAGSGRAELSLDGPVSYINPKTGTHSFGPFFTFTPTGNVSELLSIYDKRNIPDVFGRCAPQNARFNFDSSLKLLKKGGCNKVITTPLGRTVYVVGGYGNDRPYYVVDIDNSRIVFDSLPASDSMADFVKAVDSFREVPLSDFAFTDPSTYSNGAVHHYSR